MPSQYSPSVLTLSTATVPTQYRPSVLTQYTLSTAPQYSPSALTHCPLSTDTVPTQYRPPVQTQYPPSTCTFAVLGLAFSGASACFAQAECRAEWLTYTGVEETEETAVSSISLVGCQLPGWQHCSHNYRLCVTPPGGIGGIMVASIPPIPLFGVVNVL